WRATRTVPQAAYKRVVVSAQPSFHAIDRRGHSLELWNTTTRADHSDRTRCAVLVVVSSSDRADAIFCLGRARSGEAQLLSSVEFVAHDAFDLAHAEPTFLDRNFPS